MRHTQITPELAEAACGQNSRPLRVTDSETIDRLKFRFVETARIICPQFRITAEQRHVIAAVFDWCLMRPGELDPAKGLWLHGDIGSGKTTLLRIVKKFCHDYGCRPGIDPGKRYSFRISNAIEVCSEFSKGGYPAIQQYIDSRCQAFDEIGSESSPTGYYGTAENVFQYIFQQRYDKRHSGFTHVTTNHNVSGIADLYSPRIYDRCREMFNFVELNGTTFRKDKETKI